MNIVGVETMPAPMNRSQSEPHKSVMRNEVLRFLDVKPKGVYVDATLGAGGHSEAILEAFDDVRLIGIDRDAHALELANKRLARFGDRAVLVHGRFSELEHHLDALGVGLVDGVVADVGLSSMQLDEAARGMSFRFEGPLDMRMDTQSGRTALEWIDALSDDELSNVLYRFGEERRSRRVSRCIKQARERGELETTLDLRRAVVRAVGPARVGGVDPATRTFQALRILVNGELDELSALLSAGVKRLAPMGVMVVISFHSLEDRLVKQAFRAFCAQRVLVPLTKKPVMASDEEIAGNPRARSAKLRAARRAADGAELMDLGGMDAEGEDDERESEET